MKFQINKEAESGSKFCLQRIKELINTAEGNLNNGKDTSTPYKNYIIDNKSQSMIDFQWWGGKFTIECCAILK